MLNNMLSDIIAILICDEHRRTLVQLLQNSDLIMRLAVLQDPLNDSTTIRMGGENVDLSSESFDDELNVLSWHTFDSFLHDVVAVLVLDTLQNINLQLLD